MSELMMYAGFGTITLFAFTMIYFAGLCDGHTRGRIEGWRDRGAKESIMRAGVVKNV